MSRHRSRSRTSYRERYEYIYEESSSESEEDNTRGRVALRFLDIVPPQFASRQKVIIDKAINKHSHREDMLGNLSQFQSSGWASCHMARGGHTSHGSAQANCNGYNVGGYRPRLHKKDKHKETKKLRHEEMEDSDEDKIRKEKEDLKKRLKALEDREGRGKKDTGIVKHRDILDVDLDIAQCNQKLSTLEGFKYQIRRKRSSSRTGVHFHGFDNVFNYTI